MSVVVGKKSIKFNREKPYVILCEGVDELYFLVAYLDYLEKYEQNFQDCHFVVDLGGVEDVGKKLKTIKAIPNYEYVKGILIVRDAEKNADAATVSLLDHIQRTWGIELSKNGDIGINEDGMKIGFFLFPGLQKDGTFENGTLEDLCWKIVRVSNENISTDNLIDITERHLDHIVSLRGKMKKPHKNKLHLLLSSTDRFVDTKIGEAARANAFDFSGEGMERLKELILQMQDEKSV